MKIDVCLVAGRRPGLLRATLESFNSNLFQNFTVDRFIANIDPIFGSKADHRECLTIIKDLFPNAHITSPDAPGFCAAVKRNWAATNADVAFHLEDDWLLHREVTPSDLSGFEDNRIAQICFNHAYKQWPIREKGPFAYGRRRIQFLGLSTPFKTGRRPFFTTSRASFAGRSRVHALR